MSEEKKPEPILLVAVERGFRHGVLVQPGEKFTFTPTKFDKDGKPKLPKWTQLASIPLPVKPKAGDLKPKAAQDAVRGKAAKLTGNDLA